MEPIYRSLLICVSVTCIVLGSCSKDRTPEQPSTPTNSSFLIEKDPVYSASRGAVFFVTVDTSHVERTTISFAQADMPVRRHLPIGGYITLADTTSLTVAPSGARLMYLAGGLRHECWLTSQPTCSTSISIGEVSLAYLTDTSWVFGRNDSLFVMNHTANPSFLHLGWEPRLERNGQIVFVSPTGLTAWAILRYAPGGGVDTLLTISGESSQQRPRWPDLDDTGRWLAYTIDSSGGYRVQVADLSQHLRRTLVSTLFPRVCVIPQGLVLFTDSSGTLYQIGYSGGVAVPWIDVEQP